MSRAAADIRQDLRTTRRARQRAQEAAARARTALERARTRGERVAACECRLLDAKREVRRLEARACQLEAELLEGWAEPIRTGDAA